MNTSTDDLSDKRSIVDVITQIKEGRLDPKILDKEERQACVEVMKGEGMSAANMAQILKVSDKTIQRDLKDIMVRNAIQPNQQLVEQCVGELMVQMRISRDHLMRLARSREGSIGEKAQAEMYAFQAIINGFRLMQSLGYLPEKPQAVVGDFYHHGLPTKEDVQKELIELEAIIQSDPSRIGEELKDIKRLVAEEIQPLNKETDHDSQSDA